MSDDFVTTLEEAQEQNGYILMEGDWGGQIYLSVPAKRVKCNDDALLSLLTEIDRWQWKCNEGDGRKLVFVVTDGSWWAGGMGGGLLTDTLWLHRDVEPMRERIEAVLFGKEKSNG